MMISVDPGKHKTGIAIYNPEQGVIIHHQVVLTEEFFQKIEYWQKKYNLIKVILGNGTLSKEFTIKVKEIMPDCSLEIIDEAYSTLEARKLYFELFPPKGVKKLIPITMQSPRVPIDDLVAVILIKRYLGKLPEIK